VGTARGHASGHGVLRARHPAVALREAKWKRLGEARIIQRGAAIQVATQHPNNAGLSIWYCVTALTDLRQCPTGRLSPRLRCFQLATTPAWPSAQHAAPAAWSATQPHERGRHVLQIRRQLERRLLRRLALRQQPYPQQTQRRSQHKTYPPVTCCVRDRPYKLDKNLVKESTLRGNNSPR
jgi:hypothetical protein